MNILKLENKYTQKWIEPNRTAKDAKIIPSLSQSISFFVLIIIGIQIKTLKNNFKNDYTTTLAIHI